MLLMPTRRPVKEPGPTVTAKPSSAAGSTPRPSQQRLRRAEHPARVAVGRDDPGLREEPVVASNREAAPRGRRVEGEDAHG